MGEPLNLTLFKNIFLIFTELVKKSLVKEDLNELKLLVKSFFYFMKTMNETNKEHKMYMDESHFATLGPILKSVLDLVKEAKEETLKSINSKKAGHELDEEDMENIKEELAKVCAASTYVMEISGQSVLNFKEKVAPMVKDNLLNFFALNLNNYKMLSESELLDATCFFCDFIEYSFNKDVAMVSELNNKFLEIFNNTTSMDVKQTLSYGMGVFAMHIPQANYSEQLPKVFTVI